MPKEGDTVKEVEVHDLDDDDELRKIDSDSSTAKPPPLSSSSTSAAAAGSTATSATADDDATKIQKKRPASDMNEESSSKPVEPLQRQEKEQKNLYEEGERPQKKFYRQRAHCNPLSHNDSFAYKPRPELMDWRAEHYPDLVLPTATTPKEEVKAPSGAWIQKKITINPCTPTVLDIGCGFGGLTLALAKVLPDEIILGMEIRAKVTEFVRLRILNARKEFPGQYQNASVLRTNSMKLLPHFFPKASLNKLFFCFPDPHFKRKNWPRRIISERLLSEYAFLLRPVTGRLYCITDVLELHQWHVQKCDAHPLFRRMTEDELLDDPCVAAMQTETEESKKVERNKGDKHYAVYQRVTDQEALQKEAKTSFFAE